MSSSSEPVSLERFAEALRDLPLVSLRLKILEIRNSVSHLIYSNAELKPYAEANPPDDVCVEAIRENEIVLERMAGRLSILKLEVQERGEKWEDFEAGVFERDGAPDSHEAGDSAAATGDAVIGPRTTADDSTRAHPAWSDGTFQVGTLSLGHNEQDALSNARAPARGLSDADLARQLEERMRMLEAEDDANNDAQNGIHL
ncbi:hypothetical protein jhhlp_002251 [Lomentospora prolificans]|uniref:Uncharacterized protein n=1 Tax=Lomentospora prolificans TaxID=41688 RepID=A0A2N3NDJ7_9PEZI|nr:hypothetical protein jhhlp_002251 [Lomentospora prolificans]